MSARLSVLLALAAALALPAAAQGFTASKVTAPADGFYSVAGAGGTLDVRAELTGAGPTDKADLVCVVLRNSFRVLFDAADASGGTVEKTIDLADLRSGTCLILAVPDGTDVASADLTQFTGPIITTDWRETSRTPPDDASGDVPYDFFFAQQQARGYGDYDGISSCGICDTSLLFADTRRASEFMFFGNAFLGLQEPAPRMRSHLRIDGRNAYGSYVARLDLDPTEPGYTPGSELEGVPPIAATATGGRGEDLVIDEAEDLVRCQNGTVPALGCGRFVGTGVRVTRRIRQTRGGTLIHVVDVFRSVDGQQHALDLHWLNVFRDPPGDPEPSFQLPWVSGDYEIPPSGRQRPAPPGAPFTIFARANHHAGDGERPWPQGAMVFDTPASGPIEFFSPTEFIVPMNVTVPAGGEATVRQSFVTTLTRAEAAEVAAAAEDGFVAPTVAITAPAEGATFSRSPTVDVTGTAADGARRPTVTLNGTEVLVGADGTWRGRVTLARGDNALTAVARDAAGGEATAIRRVVYAPLAADRTKPVLSRVSLSPKRFRVGAARSGAAAKAAAAARGTTLRFRLSEPATVRLIVARPLAGRRSGGRCRPPTRALRGRPRCVRLKRLGTISRAARAGANRVRFTGRVRGRALRPRAYRMRVDAIDAARNRSAARTLRFRIVRR